MCIPWGWKSCLSIRVVWYVVTSSSIIVALLESVYNGLSEVNKDGTPLRRLLRRYSSALLWNNSPATINKSTMFNYLLHSTRATDLQGGHTQQELKHHDPWTHDIYFLLSYKIKSCPHLAIYTEWWWEQLSDAYNTVQSDQVLWTLKTNLVEFLEANFIKRKENQLAFHRM